MALGEKRNGSVFATAAQRRDAAEYQVTSEPEVVPVVVDDTPQRTLNTDIGAISRTLDAYQKVLADLNRDGKVNGTDVLWIRQIGAGSRTLTY